MDEYIGLDVSMKDTAISVRRGGKRVWRGKCASDPQLIAQVICKRAPAAKRVVFEMGPLSVWFFHALTAEGMPAICIDARHAKAALDMAANKTDANDADGLAHLAEVGFYREVRVKSFDSMLARTLVAARTRLVRIGTELSNQIRGLMKTFGLIVPPVMGSKFERHVEALLADKGFRHWRWHLDEMYVKLNGEMVYFWRAVDHEGEILESYVTKTRDKSAALRFLKKALKRHGWAEEIIPDGLRSYSAAMRDLGNLDRQEVGRYLNNRVENSHLPFRRRERAMLRFRQMKSLQKFASVHASLHNHFNSERHLVDRSTYKERRSAALVGWQSLAA